MTATPVPVEALLDPIPVAGMPAGMDMRWTREWDRLKEARRFDDGLETGKWQKRETKTADWTTVHDLAASLLREHTKDLQISMWLTEANIKLYGFPGLRDGLHVTRELMQRYWNQGLFPNIEDGPEDRSGPFEWLNSKLVDSIRSIPITARGDSGRDYSLIDLDDARRTGSEKSARDEDGDIDAVKKREFDQLIEKGHISLEMFEFAMQKTSRPACEQLASEYQGAYDEFKQLEKAVDEHFGDVAPNLGLCRNAMEDIRQAVSDILENRRKAFPDAETNAAKEMGASGGDSGSVTMRFSLPFSSQQDQSSSAGSWNEAEQLIRSGEIEKGLAVMTRVAANETTGRSRFHRKLLLAQICIETQRDKVARSILEELAEQIDKFQLENWESSELIAGVWSRIVRIYRQTDESELQDRAAKYYERLCRLDPWQALKCEA
ncbi:MAG TPA: type VI secretion system protein TssA [Bryobacteraceae bacterium]|nr:type VI secretion system protein TssA [Bryobacteraceae bacterium]